MMYKQNKKVLFILPHHNFRDKEYSWVVERLDEANIYHEVACDHLSDAQGMFGDIVTPDVLISFVSSADYDAFIFVGEEAAECFVNNNDITRIIQNAHASHKIVAAIGHAVRILALTNIISRKRIAAPSKMHREIESAGAFYSSHTTEKDGNIVTANGPYSTKEFSSLLIESLIEEESFNKRFGRKYLK